MGINHCSLAIALCLCLLPEGQAVKYWIYRRKYHKEPMVKVSIKKNWEAVLDGEDLSCDTAAIDKLKELGWSTDDVEKCVDSRWDPKNSEWLSAKDGDIHYAHPKCKHEVKEKKAEVSECVVLVECDVPETMPAITMAQTKACNVMARKVKEDGSCSSHWYMGKDKVVKICPTFLQAEEDNPQMTGCLARTGHQPLEYPLSGYQLYTHHSCQFDKEFAKKKCSSNCCAQMEKTCVISTEHSAYSAGYDLSRGLDKDLTGLEEDLLSFMGRQ